MTPTAPFGASWRRSNRWRLVAASVRGTSPKMGGRCFGDYLWRLVALKQPMAAGGRLG
jgi:hypothetical protein